MPALIVTGGLVGLILLGFRIGQKSQSEQANARVERSAEESRGDRARAANEAGVDAPREDGGSTREPATEPNHSAKPLENYTLTTPAPEPRWSEPVVSIGQEFRQSSAHPLRTPWVVQLGSYNYYDEARAALGDARAAGFSGALLQMPTKSKDHGFKLIVVVALEGGQTEDDAKDVVRRADYLVTDTPFVRELAKWCDDPFAVADVHVCRNWSAWAATFPSNPLTGQTPATVVDRESAINAAKRLEAAGFPARVILHQKGPWDFAAFMVLAGVYESRSAALADQARLLKVVGGDAVGSVRLMDECPSRVQAEGYEICLPGTSD
ncbi:SPOR domain-containing protein [Nannocystaceae bacterium ST9]